ncbi:MAG: type VI secretion system amidase effector protein Tae4 [Azoarcus sp.]|jgi:hypothetical protein|nr:type VI secretion system amidase effector protein Tae4 [Azoarcus sp.]
MARPAFNDAWHAFMQINVPVKAVGDIIGGKVKYNIDIPEDEGGFANACPIRMSYVLNKTSFPIRRSSGYAMVSGGDGKWYIFRVQDMKLYLRSTFGKPDKEVKGSPEPSDFSGMKGILVVQGKGWGNAGGHITLWDGSLCSDSCHLARDPDNGTFIPGEASLWALP